jgi:phospholipase C
VSAPTIPTTITTPKPIQHVVWIFMENKGYSDIIGNPAAPYINSLASTYGSATNYDAIGHYSADNYVAATSGSPCCFDDSYADLSQPSIFSQLPVGQSQSLEESMPSPCDTSDSGEYAVRHNPESYYTTYLAGDCQKYDVPLVDGTVPDFGSKFTFVTPNLIDDMHDGTIQDGNNWLKQEIPLFIESAQYQAGTTAIFITWDESSGSGQGPTNPPNNQVPCIVISPYTSHVQDSTPFTHYSLLRTAEDLLGLPPLGRAAQATSMVGHFGL